MHSGTRTLRNSLITVGLLGIASVPLSIFGHQPAWQSLRIVSGSFGLLFLPGYALSYVFFLDQKEKTQSNGTRPLDGIERLLLSFALSMVSVPLLLFVGNVIGVPIRFWTVISAVGVIIGAGSIITYWRKKGS